MHAVLTSGAADSVPACSPKHVLPASTPVQPTLPYTHMTHHCCVAQQVELLQHPTPWSGREQSHTHQPYERCGAVQVELLQPYFAAPDFNYDAARKASGNVAGLCNWAAAMCTYHEVAKVVEPKIAKLREAEVGVIREEH
eukprot:1158208-Pelagomonas_calceolata.AAC.14